MVRNNISIRRRTHVAQKLPEKVEEEIMNFQKFIIDQRKMHKFPLAAIINADQTPLTFDMVPPYTLDKIGTKSVNIRTTGKKRFSLNF